VSPVTIVPDVFQAVFANGVTLSAEQACALACLNGGKCEATGDDSDDGTDGSIGLRCVCRRGFFGRTCAQQALRLDSVQPGASPLQGGVGVALLGVRLNDAMLFIDGERVSIDTALSAGVVVQSARGDVSGVNVDGDMDGIGDYGMSHHNVHMRRLATLSRATSTTAARVVTLDTTDNDEFTRYFVAPPGRFVGAINFTLALPLLPLPGQPSQTAEWRPSLATTETVSASDSRLAAYTCDRLSTCAPARWASECR
jgi:hypothetical protein